MIRTQCIADGVLEFDITGKLKAEHIEIAIDAIEQTRESRDKLSLLIDLSGYAGMTPAAFLADIRYGLTHISEISHYERISVITGHGWIERLIKLENWLLPAIDIRTFKPDQRSQAEKFALGQIIDTTIHEPHVRRIPTSREDLVAIRVTGRIDRDDATAIVAVLQQAFTLHGKIDLLVALDGTFAFDPGILLSSDLWKTKRDSLSHVSRYAVVGAPPSIAGLAERAGSLTRVDMRTFDAADESAAWSWLEAAPLSEAA